MKIRKILIIILPLIIFVGAYYAFIWRDIDKIENIIIEGDITIGREEILKAARLTGGEMPWENVNVDVLQDRISKHPEVKKVFVSKELPSDLKIEIVERKPLAIINTGIELLLVDDELEIFTFKNIRKIYDLPLISGIRTEIKPNADKFNKDDLRLALYIVVNSYRKSKLLYNNISEINLSVPDRIIIYLSEDSAPVYFPRKNDVTIADKDYQQLLSDKLDVLSSYVVSNLGGIFQRSSFGYASGIDNINSEINYVDMRFSNQVIVNFNQ